MIARYENKKAESLLHNFVMYSSVWYDSLIKPVFQPPAWIFSPVWIILYGTLFIALILYSVKFTKKEKIIGYIYFVIHMMFNILWSPVFFYLHRIDIALSIILVMDITAMLMILKFFDIAKLSGTILVPYFFWLMFATYLNIGFFILN